MLAAQMLIVILVVGAFFIFGGKLKIDPLE
jgi:hypothetical protein